MEERATIDTITDRATSDLQILVLALTARIEGKAHLQRVCARGILTSISCSCRQNRATTIERVTGIQFVHRLTVISDKPAKAKGTAITNGNFRAEAKVPAVGNTPSQRLRMRVVTQSNRRTPRCRRTIPLRRRTPATHGVESRAVAHLCIEQMIGLHQITQAGGEIQVIIYLNRARPHIRLQHRAIGCCCCTWGCSHRLTGTGISDRSRNPRRQIFIEGKIIKIVVLFLGDGCPELTSHIDAMTLKHITKSQQHTKARVVTKGVEIAITRRLFTVSEHWVIVTVRCQTRYMLSSAGTIPQDTARMLQQESQIGTLKHIAARDDAWGAWVVAIWRHVIFISKFKGCVFKFVIILFFVSDIGKRLGHTQ